MIGADYWLSCDHPWLGYSNDKILFLCPTYFPENEELGPYDSPERLLLSAKADGWTEINNHNYCPEHSGAKMSENEKELLKGRNELIASIDSEAALLQRMRDHTASTHDTIVYWELKEIYEELGK